MSINVTVNGNPICVRRSRMVLSDMEQIKKNERDRKRRLRLEQVRQQSKEISCKLLERSKNLAKQELNKLDRDAKSELRKMHERKIMDIQRKYQEDMEEIGSAHSAATQQPDVEAIIEADRYNARTAAAERGKEAAQRLKESSQKEDSAARQQERLRQVREVENVRSAMVAQLSSKIAPLNTDEATESSQDTEIIMEPTNHRPSPKKKKYKKPVGKKSPGKVVSKSNIKVVGHQQKPKSPRHVTVEIRRSNSKSPKRTSSRGRKEPSDVIVTSNRGTSVCKNVSVATESGCTNSRCNRDTDDQEPRKTVPTMKLSPTKADKVARYNPEDYKQKTSDSNGSSSSSLSNDSSYFSDGCGDFILPKTTPKHHPSSNKSQQGAGSTVQLYDHTTRQRNTYNQPIGLVERINIVNEPNAEDAARELLKSESATTNHLENRRLTAQKRGNDAILRDRVRRDYEAMMKNLDHLRREERKLEATQPHCRATDPISESRRNERQNVRQRTMDRAFENILRDTKHAETTSRSNDHVERIITIPPRTSERTIDEFPEATWQKPPFVDNPHRQDNATRDNNADEEMSREEHILEMLKKVERQKRLLLREFGADLPNGIFTATMTPLFDGRQPESSERTPLPPPPSLPVVQSQPSPEIKIINMSNSDEAMKKSKNSKKKSAKKTKSPSPPAAPPSSTTMETGVQTSRLEDTPISRDKSTQVEIPSEQTKPVVSQPLDSESLHYVEPRVTVITPQANDSTSTSTSSSASRITGIIIEVDEKHVRVTPKKKKSIVEKSSKRVGSKLRSKPRSLPASTAGSPIKRNSTSAPSSRAPSPRIIDDPGTANKITSNNVRVEKTMVKKIQPTTSRRTNYVRDYTNVTSTPQSTPETHDDVFASKPYRIFRQPTFKRTREIRENSDTSTSYASLPAPTPVIEQTARQGITPILELLDSSANESARILRKSLISPVSTPETPSPRIINVPSNIPRPEIIGRILRFDSFANGTIEEDSTLPSSTFHEQSTSTDHSLSRNNDERGRENSRTFDDRRDGNNTSIYCSCANPSCRMMHDNATDIRDYAEKTDNPEVLKKYEDLQNVCTERIASLTELIRRVRSEQSGMEFSVTNPADETSLMQLPPPRTTRNDLQSVQRLVESIEAIHCQLAKTLQASQKIITRSVIDPTLQTPETVATTNCATSCDNKSKASTSTSTSTDDTPIAVATTAPKVISDEPVRIDVDELKRGRGAYTAMIVTTENNDVVWPARDDSRRHEEMVEKLYHEILEQSKDVNGTGDKTSTNVNVESNLNAQRTPSPPQNFVHARTQSSTVKKNDDEVTRDVPTSTEPENNSFVPILTGLPKIPRLLPAMPPGLRSRPPPASAAYRNDILSPRHELSTIVEFDTPDTANRSQGSTKSPTAKSRRVLELRTPEKSTTSGSSAEKDANTQTSTTTTATTATTTTKPSVHVAPLMSENSSRTISRRSNARDPTKPEQKFVIHDALDRIASNETTTKCMLSQGHPSTSLDAATTKLTDDDDPAIVCQRQKTGKTENIDANSLQQRCDTSNEERFIVPASGTINRDYEMKNDNKTSTSSNNYSGLSGISEIISTPTSEIVKWASSSEEIETALKKMGLGWAIVTLKKTREASALSSSSNSDVTPVNTARRTKSPIKKILNDSNFFGLPDFSDVSSISIKEASKSTERAVLMKARTSTPNIRNSNSSNEKSTTTSSSVMSLQDASDSLTAPNISLGNKR